MSVRLGVKVTGLDAASLNPIIEEALGRAGETVTSSPDLRKAIGGVFLEMTNPYVPMKTGRLRDTAFAEADGRVDWPAPYAMNQYTTQYKHYTTEGTGPYWVDRMLENDHSAFVAEIQPLIIAAFDKTINGGGVLNAAYAHSRSSIRSKNEAVRKARKGQKKSKRKKKRK